MKTVSASLGRLARVYVLSSLKSRGKLTPAQHAKVMEYARADFANAIHARWKKALIRSGAFRMPEAATYQLVVMSDDFNQELVVAAIGDDSVLAAARFAPSEGSGWAFMNPEWLMKPKRRALQKAANSGFDTRDHEAAARRIMRKHGLQKLRTMRANDFKNAVYSAMLHKKPIKSSLHAALMYLLGRGSAPQGAESWRIALNQDVEAISAILLGWADEEDAAPSDDEAMALATGYGRMRLGENDYDRLVKIPVIDETSAWSCIAAGITRSQERVWLLEDKAGGQIDFRASKAEFSDFIEFMEREFPIQHKALILGLKRATNENS